MKNNFLGTGLIAGGTFLVGIAVGYAGCISRAETMKEEAKKTKEIYERKIKKIEDTKSKSIKEIEDYKKEITELKDAKREIKEEIEILKEMALDEGGNYAHVVRILDGIKKRIDKTSNDNIDEIKNILVKIDKTLSNNEKSMDQLTKEVRSGFKPSTLNFSDMILKMV